MTLQELLDRLTDIRDEEGDLPVYTCVWGEDPELGIDILVEENIKVGVGPAPPGLPDHRLEIWA